MNVLSAQQISKSHGLKNLFSDVSFGLEERDRIGIIGPNGSGKSTLMKILAGEETADSGRLTRRQQLRVSYLPQKPEFDPNHTVLEHILTGDEESTQLVRQYEALTYELAADPENPALQRRLETISHEMDLARAWELETRSRLVLGRLGVRDLTARMGDLSGGYRKRVALAQALLSESDVLMLDEPTNHLDADMIAWLEGYLQHYAGAVILVTHDRYFLDRVTRGIWEINRGELRRFDGNFSYYLERKAEIEESEAASQARKKNILRNELAWLRRGARARTTKEKGRVKRIEQMQAEPTPQAQQALKFETVSRRMGKKVAELEHVSKSFGSKLCVNDFTYIITPGERLGIIGPNGTGKTTLIRLITGELPPDSGKIEIGETIVFGHYDQETRNLPQEPRAIDYVRTDGGEMLRGADGSTVSAGEFMERFGFTGQMQYTPIQKLSGGEQRRLYLVRTLMRDPNFLILDEPTNDLDLLTLQALEDYLEEFNGCIVAISHDRYFLDRTVDHLLAYDGEGRWRIYPGGYSVYARMKAEELAAQQEDAAPKPQPSSSKPAAPGRKLSYKEQRELSDVEEKISVMEKRLGAIAEELAAVGGDYRKLQSLTTEQHGLSAQIGLAMQRWEELSNKAEQARR